MDKFIGFEPGTGKVWEEKIWKKFLEEIEDSGSRRETSKFLDSILTENEKKIISKRLVALALVRSGKSYREIGRLLWISPCTISALSKVINEIESYQSDRQFRTKRKSERRKRLKELPSPTILDYWASLPLPSKSGFRKNKRK